MMQVWLDIWYYLSFMVLAGVVVLELGCYFIVYVLLRVLLRPDAFHERFGHRSSAAIRTSFTFAVLLVLAVHFINRAIFVYLLY